jgi:dimethylhistidine N-methyltransferase
MIEQGLPDGLSLIKASKDNPQQSLKDAIAEGFKRTPKSIPALFFYDTAGSQLFEQICKLPEYYPTRTEHKILTDYARDIISTVPGDVELVELGSGSASKTRVLIDAILTNQSHLHYIPTDISTDFLLESSIALKNEYGPLSITAIAAEHNDALRLLPEGGSQSRLFLFLGSNIGNFKPEAAINFIGQIRRRMRENDHLLIGFDLVKDRQVLFDAYNDKTGVTAEFNKNLLLRINRELDGDFDLNLFDHCAPFVEEHSRIEMRLISRCRQQVYVKHLGQRFDFEEGEYIHTENSYKYTLEGFGSLCEAAGMRMQKYWLDVRGWFAVGLFRKAGGG